MSTPSSTTRLLAIGINQYRCLPQLSKAANDARDVAALFETGAHGGADCALLLDERASREAISAELGALARKAQPQDLVIIFFSGHGLQLSGGFWPGEYLCPVEMTPASPATTAISCAEWTAALRAINAGRLVVLLDACHAGGIGQPKGVRTVKSGLSTGGYERCLQGQGRYLLASCTADEPSVELTTMRNGLFTHVVLDGLRGKAAREDGVVWVTDLFSYAYQEVSRYHYQHPFLKAHGEDFRVLEPTPAPARAKQETVGVERAPAAEPLQPRKLQQLLAQVYDPTQLDSLAFGILGIRFNRLKNEDSQSRALTLVERCWHLRRSGRYEALIQALIEDYPYLRREVYESLAAN